MRISDWSSDVCSSDLARSGIPARNRPIQIGEEEQPGVAVRKIERPIAAENLAGRTGRPGGVLRDGDDQRHRAAVAIVQCARGASLIGHPERSEEHTSEPQSLMRISYDVFCLKKKKHKKQQTKEFR